MRIRMTNTINLLLAAVFVLSAKAATAWDNVPNSSIPVHMVVTVGGGRRDPQVLGKYFAARVGQRAPEPCFI